MVQDHITWVYIKELLQTVNSVEVDFDQFPWMQFIFSLVYILYKDGRS